MFGYGAENTFKDLAAIHKSDSDTDTDSEEETDTSTSKPSKNWKDYYYFHRFKMLLHKDEVRTVFFHIIKLLGFSSLEHLLIESTGSLFCFCGGFF